MFASLVTRWPRQLMALTAMVAMVPIGEVGAHSEFPTIQSMVSIDDKQQGHWLLATTFGLLDTIDAGKTVQWRCEAAYGKDSPAMDASLVRLPGGLLVATGGKLFASKDGGCNWSAVTGSLGDRWVWQVQRTDAQPKNAWMVAAKPGQTQSIWRGDPFASDGLKPVYQTQEHELRRLRFAASKPGTIRALAWLKGQVTETSLLASDDDGKTWALKKLTGVPGFLQLLPIHPDNPGILHVHAINDDIHHSVWRSSNDGKSFDKVLALKPIVTLQAGIWQAGVGGPVLLVGGLTGGLWRSVDGGQHFEAVANAPQIGCLARLDDGLYACSNPYIDGPALMRSDDAGLSWSAVLCFDTIDGPRTCNGAQSVEAACTEEWPELAKKLQFSNEGACGSGQAGQGDAGGGEDGFHDSGGATPDVGQAGDAEVLEADADSTTDAPPTTVKPDNDGCTASPSGASPSAWLLLWTLAWLSTRIRRRRDPLSR